MPRQVTEAEINDFLESKPNIQISTIDPKGYPYNQHLWFLYERLPGKIYLVLKK